MLLIQKQHMFSNNLANRCILHSQLSCYGAHQFSWLYIQNFLDSGYLMSTYAILVFLMCFPTGPAQYNLCAPLSAYYAYIESSMPYWVIFWVYWRLECSCCNVFHMKRTDSYRAVFKQKSILTSTYLYIFECTLFAKKNYICLKINSINICDTRRKRTCSAIQSTYTKPS